LQTLKARTIEAKRHLQIKIVFWLLFVGSRGELTELEFDSIFDPKPGAEEELKKGFQGVFQAAAQGLEKLAN